MEDFFHFTTEVAAEAISRTKVLTPSSVGAGGKGIYFTDLNPWNDNDTIRRTCGWPANDESLKKLARCLRIPMKRSDLTYVRPGVYVLKTNVDLPVKSAEVLSRTVVDGLVVVKTVRKWVMEVASAAYNAGPAAPEWLRNVAADGADLAREGAREVAGFSLEVAGAIGQVAPPPVRQAAASAAQAGVEVVQTVVPQVQRAAAVASRLGPVLGVAGPLASIAMRDQSDRHATEDNAWDSASAALAGACLIPGAAIVAGPACAVVGLASWIRKMTRD